MKSSINVIEPWFLLMRSWIKAALKNKNKISDNSKCWDKSIYFKDIKSDILLFIKMIT